jgi:hypothetical protein
VRNGYLPERELVTGIGPIRDSATTGSSPEGPVSQSDFAASGMRLPHTQDLTIARARRSPYASYYKYEQERVTITSQNNTLKYRNGLSNVLNDKGRYHSRCHLKDRLPTERRLSLKIEFSAGVKIAGTFSNAL